MLRGTELTPLDRFDSGLLLTFRMRSRQCWKGRSGPRAEALISIMELHCEQVAGGCNATLQALDVGPALLYYACDRVILLWDYHLLTWVGTLEGHTGRVNCLKALEEGGVVSGGCDCKLIVWVGSDEGKAQTLPAPVVQCTSKGETVVSLTNSGRLTLWRRTGSDLTSEQVFEFGSNLQESSVLFTTGNLPAFACGGCDGLVHVYTKPGEWEFSASLHGHTKGVRALDYRNGLLASASHDATIRLWRVYEHPPTSFIDRFGHTPLRQSSTSIKLESVLTSHQAPVQSVCFSPTGSVLSSSLDFTVMVWEEEQTAWSPRYTMGQMTGNKNAFFGAASDPSGEHIFAHSFNGAVYHWQHISSGWVPASAPSGHLSPVTSLSLGPGFLLTSSQDQTCRIFASQRWIELSRPLVHGYDLNCAVFGHGVLVTGGDEKVIRVFEPSIVSAAVLGRFSEVRLEGKKGTSGQALGLSNKPEESPSVVEIPQSPPLDDFLSTHTLWPECRKLFGHQNEVSALALAHKRKLLASACKSQNEQDAEIYLWDLETMSVVCKLPGHKLTVLCLKFSPDDEYLLSAGRGRECILHKRGESGYELHQRISAHTRIVYSCAWSPDGDRFLTVSRDKRVKEWNTAGECVATYKAASEVTACVYISPQLAAVGLSSGNILMLRLAAEVTVEGQVKQSGEVTALEATGDLLFSAGTDFTVRVYKFR